MEMCSGREPEGPHTQSVFESHHKGIETLEALRDDPSTSGHDRAILDSIIERFKATPPIIDISASEMNRMARRKGCFG